MFCVGLLTGLIFTFSIFAPLAHASLVSKSSSVSLTKGLVGYWTFDSKNLRTNVADSSGLGNTGYLQGFTSTTSALVAGKIGQGLKFDGVDDCGVIGNQASLINLTNTLSVSAWIKTKVSALQRPIAGDSYPNSEGATFGYTLEDYGSNYYRFVVENSTNPTSGGIVSVQSTAGSVPLNKWTHIVGTYDGSGNLRMYINGTLNNSTASSTISTINASNKRFIIGSSDNTTGTGCLNFYNGSIDDVRVYNRALSAAEVTALYNLNQSKYNVSVVGPSTGSGQLAKGLVGYWTFDSKNLRTNVADSSGLGNTGYLQGFTSTTSALVAGKIGQAIKFDGVNDWTKVNDAVGLSMGENSGYTVTGWFKRSTSKAQTLVSKYASNNYEYNIMLDPNNAMLVRAWTDAGVIVSGGGPLYWNSNAAIPNPSNWHQFIVIKNNNVLSIGLDGVMNGSVGLTDTPGSGTAAIAIGQMGTGVSQNFSGSVDDVRIYNRALSASEVTALYNLNQSKYNVSVASPSTGSGQLAKGLVGYWTFDSKNLRANVADSSGLGNTGYLQNFTSTTSALVAGKIGQGLKFDGVDDAIKVGTKSSLQLTSTLTVSAWVYLKSNSGNQSIIININNGVVCESFYLAIGSGVGCSGLTASRFNFEVVTSNSGQAVMISSSNAPVNKWTHVLGVYDGSTMKLYINGTLDNTKTNVTGTISSTMNQFFSIGGDISGAVRYMLNGSLDDVRVYNRALSASEVLQLYNLGR